MDCISSVIQYRRIVGFVFLLLVASHSVLSQAENVPANHSVYAFLKRLEVKGVIERYHDAILPLSRRQVAQLLVSVKDREHELTAVERAVLADLFVEFQYDIHGSLTEYHSFIESPESSFTGTITEYLSEKEKFLYAYTDTNASFFVDGLLTLDFRRSTGDAVKGDNAAFVQFGGRIRGSIYDDLGYYLQATNAQFWGSRKVLQRDRYLSQSFTLGSADIQNFDFVEGYVRYEGGIVSLQVGRERLLWGNGYGDKLILSDNPRVFDFTRADVEYKSFKYSFLHGWLLGKKSSLPIRLPFDTAGSAVEPVVADKYIAGHRFEVSFPAVVDVGFQEIVIYSNRSPDLAYLNPVTLIEAAQRSREERDNVLWAFDVQTHAVSNVELHAAIYFDDINFPRWGTKDWVNRYAYQAGAMVVDPVLVPNVSFMVEYTRVEPYTFSHGRSRDNDYGSLGRFLGHHIGPNADSWLFRLDHYFSNRMIASARVEFQREGNNLYDSTGTLTKNVGGDFLVPHRSVDSNEKEFLGGDFVKTFRLQGYITYEIVNEVFVDVRYEMTRRRPTVGKNTVDHDFGIALRIDF